MSNNKLIIAFKYLATLRDIQGKEDNRNALNTVIQSLETANFTVTSGEQAKQYLKGVGAKSVNYINSILQNNDPNKCGIYELDNLDSETRNKLLTIFEMLKISGVGIATAKLAYDNGMRDIETFKQYLATQGNTRQQIGIKYENDFEKRIPRDKVTKFINLFEDGLKQINKYYNIHMNFEVGGSYKRGQENSGDIDILLWSLIPHQTELNFVNIIAAMQQLNLLKETISFGNSMYQGTAHIDLDFPAVRIDIKALNNINEYYYAVLYFTGPGKFNEMMRERAKSMGLTLGNDEMKFTNTGEKIYVRNEKDIFDILGMEWLPPSERR